MIKVYYSNPQIIKNETKTNPQRISKTNRYECRVCEPPKDCGSYNGCQSHILEEHIHWKYACTSCGFTSFNPSYFSKHLKDHLVQDDENSQDAPNSPENEGKSGGKGGKSKSSH